MSMTKTSEEIAERVVEIIANILDVEKGKVTREAMFFIDLPMDPLDLIEITMGIEDEFDVHFPQDDVDGLKTVGDAIDYVVKHVG